MSERSEHIELYGRVFTFRFVDRPDLRRVEVEILEGRGLTARRYVPTPVRGRTADDARDRAREVLQNYAGLERYLGLVQREVRRIAPEAGVAIDENAQEVSVDLTGPRRLRAPLRLVREDALDPERSDEELVAFIRAHLEAFLEPSEPP